MAKPKPPLYIQKFKGTPEDVPIDKWLLFYMKAAETSWTHRDRIRRTIRGLSSGRDHILTVSDPTSGCTVPPRPFLTSFHVTHSGVTLKSPKIIVRSSKTTGISNRLDGMEDDVVHDSGVGDDVEAGSDSDEVAISDSSFDSDSE
ncbi:hypothetical protein HPB51_023390 [Rhipicephalus microplus]|uniref:Uncharacterized protein n=1 Tax=Rhipicephalus microplus TaxID=6941 RepID=A0A9J6DKG8_RHIMP|nr:hypothetical protein HPB51_023390 [Rhipicephalus microplus]